ncbi:putative cytochrome p450 monooxygenase protein [Seiridium cardinale]
MNGASRWKKLQANSSLLIIVGSETTATQLSGVTYFLMTNPDAMKKLTDEIQGTFNSEKEVNFNTVNELTYQNAWLGRNLAYFEMRTILARTLWNFDPKIADESLNWLAQKNYNLWKKSPLKAYLTPVAR